MNVFINEIDEQSVKKRQRRYGVTEHTNELTRSQKLQQKKSFAEKASSG